MTEHHQPAPLLGSSPEALELLLDKGSAFVPPSRILSGLSAQEACREVAGAPHTIAEIVAHLHFWQTYTLALARGDPAAQPTHAAEGWPAAPPKEWEGLRQRFLDNLSEMKRVARAADLSRPVRGRDTLGYELTLHVMQNAVHFGQVILLRQLLGTWPPEGGGDTW